MEDIIGILAIPSTEIMPSGFVDIHPPNGQVYLLTIGIISGTTGACVVSIRDDTGGMNLFIAQPVENRVANGGGFATANHESWIRINNVDAGTVASYAISGIVLKVASR